MVFNTGAALLDAIVLAVVSKEENGTYGYKITQDVRAVLDVSESTLYPILRRLEAAGFISVRSSEHNGRLRKYYHINQAGKERLCAFSEEWREISAIYQFVTREESENE